MNAKIILLVLLNQNCLLNAAHKELLTKSYNLLTRVRKWDSLAYLRDLKNIDRDAELFANHIDSSSAHDEERKLKVLTMFDAEFSDHLAKLDNQFAEYQRLSDEIKIARKELSDLHYGVRRLMGAVRE